MTSIGNTQCHNKFYLHNFINTAILELFVQQQHVYISCTDQLPKIVYAQSMNHSKLFSASMFKAVYIMHVKAVINIALKSHKRDNQQADITAAASKCVSSEIYNGIHFEEKCNDFLSF